MEYTIKKLSQLSGVTTRTLRYYDSIDLLKPKRINSSGYRIYGQKEVNRLQQILFYREFDLPLKEIKQLLDDETFDGQKTLEEHREKLLRQRNRLDQLLSTIDKTLEQTKGRQKMTDKEKFEGFKKQTLQQNEETFGEEIREAYGEEQVQRANQQFAKLTEAEYNELQALSDRIIEQLKELKDDAAPDSAEAVELATLHRQWLTYTWPSYSKEAHRGLADLYVMDERFTKYYDDAAGSGAAQFLRDAVHAYTDTM